MVRSDKVGDAGTPDLTFLDLGAATAFRAPRRKLRQALHLTERRNAMELSQSRLQDCGAAAGGSDKAKDVQRRYPGCIEGANNCSEIPVFLHDALIKPTFKRIWVIAQKF